MLSTLGRFVDALYVSVRFSFPPSLDALLQAGKQEAQESADDLCKFREWIPGVPGGAWFIRARGRDSVYHYVIENAAFYVAINSKLDSWPQLDIQFKAGTLYEYEADRYATIVDSVVRGLIGPGLAYKVKPSRIDLCVDFQMESFKIPEMVDVVTRANHRAVYYRGDTPNTLTLGKRGGALQSQIYCKSEELLVSDKAWMQEVWRASGVYDEELPVWRCEVRFYREGLRGFEVEDLGELEEVLGDLARYAVGDETGGGWFRVTRAGDLRQTRDRALAPWWVMVAHELVVGLLTTGRKRKGYDPTPSFQRRVELAGAHMSAAAALARIGGWSVSLRPAEFGRMVGNAYSEMLGLKDTSWPERVNAKVDEMRGHAWITKPPERPVWAA